MQKANLELPAKEFHKLHDLLGDIIDYEANDCFGNIDNLDIDLLENIRNELFCQIPAEKSYTDYALTGRSSNPCILVGKLYKIVEKTSEHGFKLEVEDGEVIYCLFKNCAFLNGRDWTIINVEN